MIFTGPLCNRHNFLFHLVFIQGSSKVSFTNIQMSEFRKLFSEVFLLSCFFRLHLEWGKHMIFPIVHIHRIELFFIVHFKLFFFISLDLLYQVKVSLSQLSYFIFQNLTLGFMKFTFLILNLIFNDHFKVFG